MANQIPTLTSELLKRATNASAEKCDQYASFLWKYMQKYNLTTDLRAASLIGIINVETGGFQGLTEEKGYTRKNANSQGWDKYLNRFSTTELDTIFSTSDNRCLDAVYGGREGNLPYPSRDGVNYRGRGLLQITHKNAYRDFSKVTGVDFVANPGLVASNPEYAAWAACWEFGVTNPKILSNADAGNFKEVCGLIASGSAKTIAPNLDGRIVAYNLALKAFGSGVVYASDAYVKTNGKKKADNAIPDDKIKYDFSKLALNIQSLETDNTDTSWGARNFSEQESDWIGLKQYILYLITRFYPHKLMPFIELVPFFTLQDTYTRKDYNNVQKDLFGQNVSTVPFSQSDLKGKDFDTAGGIIDVERYKKTVERLKELNQGNGTDITAIDPFLEYTDVFNKLNNAGIKLESKRGLNYKIYGSLVLNPAATEDALSKPGAIGLTGMEIISGAQDQFGMTLVNIKLKDVQGNKFLDPNSPWSFVLNSKPGQMMADFFFRFGWQIEIPKYVPDSKDDLTARAFWNHPGWKLFSTLNGENLEVGDNGDALKKYLSNLANSNPSMGTLTLTHSVSEKAFTKPGIEEMRDVNGKPAIQKSKIMAPDFDYYALTLLFPDINVNPQDGSIDITFNFRTKTAIANCGCPLVEGKWCKNFPDTLFGLLNRFAIDNQNYISSTHGNFDEKMIIKPAKDGENSLNWVTVIGGISDMSIRELNLNSIKITYSPKLKDQLTNAKVPDNRLLIGWLNDVLQENKMVLSCASDSNQSTRGTGADSSTFTIILDDASKDQINNSTEKSFEELAKTDPTFGNIFSYRQSDINSENFVGKRMLTQDDVFSFRFQGSLVESIQVEKSSETNEATIKARNTNMEGIAHDKSDVLSADLQNVEISAVDKFRLINEYYSTLLNVNIKAICHPWLKLGRLLYIKGMGFWDGKYIAQKITHRLEDSGKFTSEINAFRVIQPNVVDNSAQESSLNNPAIQKSESMKGRNTQSVGNYDSSNIQPISSTIPKQDVEKILEFNKTPLVCSTEQEKIITNLHPLFKNQFRAFILEFEKRNPDFYVLITSGYRTTAKQWELKYGNSKNSNIKNATPGLGYHNYGMAIDINIAHRKTGNILLNMSSPKNLWKTNDIYHLSKVYRLTWGGESFGNYYDPVHFGLDHRFNIELLLNQATRQFGADVRLHRGNELMFGNLEEQLKIKENQSTTRNPYRNANNI